MGEKYYKPIIKDGNHLAQSKKNEGRVRGISFDSDNKNPDIVEWEEVEVGNDNQTDYSALNYIVNPNQTGCYDFNASSNTHEENDQQVQLSPEAQEFCQELGTALGATLWTYTEALFENKITPWWKNTIQPRLKKLKRPKQKAETNNFNTTEVVASQSPTNAVFNVNQPIPDISVQIESAYENEFRVNMSVEEARQHVMILIYHMLGMVNEIRLLRNAHIKGTDESEEVYIERQKAEENYLVQWLATKINDFLSDERLSLDIRTSKEIFTLLGGGININGEYVPVDIEKVREAMISSQNYRESK